MPTNTLLFLLFLVVSLFANYRLRIFSLKPTIVGAIILLSLFVEIVPGTILVSFFDYPMSFGIDNVITEESKVETFRYTFVSISILLLLLSLFSYGCRFDVDIEDLRTEHFRAKIITIFSAVVIILKIVSVGHIPFLMAISGDSAGAALAKAQILKNEVGIGGLFVGYVFVYFPYVSLVYSYVHKNKYANSKLLFAVNFLLMTVYSLYDMQKSKLVVVLFVLFVLYLKSSKKINYFLVLLMPPFCLLLLGASFMLLHDVLMLEVFDSVLARLFIGQTEGSFMMYHALTPDIRRIAYGMPLAGLFEVYATDPAAEIISIFFPTAGDAWVNSNSYFQAHAWSIFGDISLIVGPLVVGVNILGLYLIKEFFSKVDRAYSSCIYIVSMLTLPIVNDFSYFLFLKAWFCFVVLMLFYVCTVRLSSYVVKLRM